MQTTALYLLAADALLAIHIAFVVFVVIALVLILAGRALRWSWILNPWFRFAHLAAIGFVVVQAWLGQICPLTNWEMALRARAGDATYAGSFISHWMSALLYYQAPAWVFTLAYTVFGLLVVAAWFLARPRPFGARAAAGTGVDWAPRPAKETPDESRHDDA